jgi:transposase
MEYLSANSLLLISAPVDMRKGIDGLSAHVLAHLGRTLNVGDGYVLVNQTGNRLALLLYDNNGAIVFKRKLFKGSFSRISSPAVYPLNIQEWNALCMGLQWQRIKAVANISKLN